MPHIITEFSKDIPYNKINDLELKIRDIFASLPDYFDYDQCKFRNIAFENYLVGKLNQNNASFIHITAKILAGRPLEAKQDLSNKIFELVNSDFKGYFSKERTDISVDIVDMDKQTYNKTRL